MTYNLNGFEYNHEHVINKLLDFFLPSVMDRKLCVSIIGDPKTSMTIITRP